MWRGEAAEAGTRTEVLGNARLQIAVGTLVQKLCGVFRIVTRSFSMSLSSHFMVNSSLVKLRILQCQNTPESYQNSL